MGSSNRVALSFDDWIRCQRAAFETQRRKNWQHRLYDAEIATLCAWLTLTEDERDDDEYRALSRLRDGRNPSQCRKDIERCCAMLPGYLDLVEAPVMQLVTSTFAPSVDPRDIFWTGVQVKHKTNGGIWGDMWVLAVEVDEDDLDKTRLILGEKNGQPIRRGKWLAFDYQPVIHLVDEGETGKPEEMNDFNIPSHLTWIDGKGRKVRVLPESVPSTRDTHNWVIERVMIENVDTGRISRRGLWSFIKSFRVDKGVTR